MKILVADDSPVLRMTLTKLLEPEGYEVVTAEDGVDGITRFYEERPDLVILDVQMPKLNGYVVCRLIKEDPAVAHIPVLILTVRTSAEDRYWGGKSGADGYLTKEALGDELLNAIRSTLAGRALRELSGPGLEAPRLEHESDVLTRVCEMLDQKLFEATVVNDITSVALRPVGLEGTVRETLVALRRLVKYEIGCVMFPSERIMAVHLDRVLHPVDVDEFQWMAAQHLSEITGIPIAPGDFTIRPLNDAEGTVDHPSGLGSVLALPLRSRGTLIAVLFVAARSAEAFGGSEERILRTVTPSIAAVLDSARQFQETLAAEAREAFSSLF